MLDAEGKVTGATLKADGSRVDYDGIGTMSKSKRNGVDPQDMIERYGADTARFYVMQANPPTDTMLWSDDERRGLVPVPARACGRWCTTTSTAGRARSRYRATRRALAKELKDLRFKLHKTIDKVADDYGRRLQFNTAIAAVRELLNLLRPT